ncbi:MAG: DNA ligase, partial [Mycobacteriaceae bacterium]|nr:DNA ligase [Mycobacteriaceae bacterium]
VAELAPQRRVGLRLLNHEGWQPIGHVLIPPNQPVPPVGAVIEVHYRNTSRDGSVSEPVYQGERREVAVEECGVSQLKFPRDPAG